MLQRKPEAGADEQAILQQAAKVSMLLLLCRQQRQAVALVHQRKLTLTRLLLVTALDVSESRLLACRQRRQAVALVLQRKPEAEAMEQTILQQAAKLSMLLLCRQQRQAVAPMHQRKLSLTRL